MILPLLYQHSRSLVLFDCDTEIIDSLSLALSTPNACRRQVVYFPPLTAHSPYGTTKDRLYYCLFLRYYSNGASANCLVGSNTSFLRSFKIYASMCAEAFRALVYRLEVYLSFLGIQQDCGVRCSGRSGTAIRSQPGSGRLWPSARVRPGASPSGHVFRGQRDSSRLQFSARGRPGSSSSSYTIRIPGRLQPPPIPSLESLGRLLERPRSSAAESGDARIPRVALDSPVSSSGSVHALATATLASKPGRDRFHPPGVVFSGF
ncbi:hypothetical protein NDU88_005185 [Pleurodeles waltl]|uniref:Uncharacterized protein n=1 Tax=Pleurodeles waltl TaxID=8319 RepID=A0AAV7RLM0_PLEWA|nr:hypothetical protein NDU88_005185 [Pleurodeles waltl]